MNVILEGTVGSTLYGLAHEGSDVDTLGVFCAPLNEVLSIDGIKKESIVRTDPDSTHHEVAKFIRLCLGCNPTVLELLYLPEYTVKTRAGEDLIMMRDSFLSEHSVRNAFGGYAMQQMKRLRTRRDEGLSGFGRGLRYEKHVRHCFRLMFEEEQLLLTGALNPVLTSVQKEDLRNLESMSHDEIEREFAVFNEYLNSLKTDLPPAPDKWALNEVLLLIRYNEG